jgi:hypothetical protein
MQMITYLIISAVLLLYNNSVQFSQKNIKDKAVEEFYKDYQVLKKFFYDQDSSSALTISEVEENTILEREIDLPFKNSKIYLFQFCKISPCLQLIVYKQNKIISFFDDSCYSKDDLITNELIKKINSILQTEGKIDRDGLIKLSNFLISVNDDGGIILESWKNIKRSEECPVPKVIKNLITAPKLVEEHDSIYYDFYCWSEHTIEVYKVVINYHFDTKSINVTQKKIGQAGIRRIKI